MAHKIPFTRRRPARGQYGHHRADARPDRPSVAIVELDPPDGSTLEAGKEVKVTANGAIRSRGQASVWNEGGAVIDARLLDVDPR